MDIGLSHTPGIPSLLLICLRRLPAPLPCSTSALDKTHGVSNRGGPKWLEQTAQSPPLSGLAEGWSCDPVWTMSYTVLRNTIPKSKEPQAEKFYFLRDYAQRSRYLWGRWQPLCAHEGATLQLKIWGRAERRVKEKPVPWYLAELINLH